jgi:acyl-CoA dehydrogenase
MRRHDATTSGESRADPLNFELSARAADYVERVTRFMDEDVIPAEPTYHRQRAELAARGEPNTSPPVMSKLKERAKQLGLWNLFLPALSGISNLDYAPIAEQSGRSPVMGPEAMNCLSPDTGNMELLHLFGTAEQKQTWLEPLLAGTIRSGFSMTEPDVASSDATNIATRITPDGDHYVVNGRKWWTTGAADPRCRLLIVLGRSDPDAPRHRQHSMVLVPIDTPGVSVIRTLPVYGYQEQQGHCEIVYDNVRVPRSSLLGAEGEGFTVAQSRLGPGRIHHCMRAIGMAERALELACRRALSRSTFGSRVADHGVVRMQIAEARMAIEQIRLLVLKTAWLIDRHGAKGARSEVSAIKVIAPRVACEVIDRAIQIHGGAGVSDDTPLALIWSRARTLRIVDGPDDIHIRKVAEQELRKYA